MENLQSQNQQNSKPVPSHISDAVITDVTLTTYQYFQKHFRATCEFLFGDYWPNNVL